MKELQKMKILVVDDDVKIREMLYEILSRLGYECKTATNGKDALSILQKDHFSIVISDIRMPGVDGLELLKEIKSKYRDIDLISMTAYSKDYSFTNVIKAGASDFILKPFLKEELEAKIKRIIRERKSWEKQKQIEEELRKQTYDLGERIKELNCLYSISKFVEETGISLERIFQGVVDLIPLAWQYPEITCARIILGDEIYKTNNFEESVWKQAKEIIVYGNTIGTLEVFYLEERPESDDGPFLKEERNLINAIAGRLGKIIERKRVEEKLKQSEKKYHNLIEFADIGIIAADHGKITHVNRKAEEIYGYSKDELIGQSPGILTPEKYSKQHKEMLNDYLKSGNLSKTIFEEEGIRKDGSLVPIEVSFSITQLEGDNTIAVMRDITERKRMERSIRKRNKELTVLNDISKAAVSSLDMDLILKNVFQKILDVTDLELDCGAILLLNEKGDKLVFKSSIGLRSEELKDDAEITLDEGVAGKVVISKEPEVVENIEEYNNNMLTTEILRKEEVKSFVSIPVVSRDKVHGTINVGSHLQHHYSTEEINLLTLIANHLGLAIDNARLLEETRNTLEELKKTQSHLLQSEKMASIGQLAAGVAHEINNPTGFVHSNLGSLNKYSNKVMELLKRYEEGLDFLKNNGSKEITSFYVEMDELKKKLKIDFIMKDFQKVISDSLEGTQRIKKIVADLKSFSRVDQGEFKHANINEGLKSTLNVLWNELKYKCTVEKHFGDLPQIYCNLGQLNQIFMNLLVNAAQAIEEKGTITISTCYLNGPSASNDKDQDYIEVKISDTGRGIPEDKLNRIFEPFFTTKDVGKGTGLGLSIAYDIIQKHKGEIKVESEVGKGTTFIIMLPLRGDLDG